MNIKIYSDREVKQLDYDVYGTQNENNITTLKIEVPEQYENWNKRIVFLTEEGNFWDYIKDNTYTIKNNITKYEELDAYIWLTENAESTEESVGDFRSKTFTLSFFVNEDANDLVPDKQQIDGFNSMLTALNVEIEKVKQINTDFTKLKEDVEQAETERNTAEESRNTAEEKRQENETARQENETTRENAETIRKKNESDRIVNENGRIEAESNRSNAEETRKTNETERIKNEAERILAEENRAKTTTEAINNIKDLSTEYEQLAEEKEAELNNIAEGVKDMATAIQFATFEVTDDMELVINTSEKLANTNFSLNEETGDLEVEISG